MYQVFAPATLAKADSEATETSFLTHVSRHISTTSQATDLIDIFNSVMKREKANPAKLAANQRTINASH